MYNGWEVSEKIPRLMGEPGRISTHAYPELDGVPVKIADEYMLITSMPEPLDLMKRRDDLEQRYTYTFELEYRVLAEAHQQH